MNLLIWQTQKKLLFQSLQDLTCQIFVAAGGGVGVVGHQGVGGRGKSHVVLLGQLLHRAVQGAEVLGKGVGRSRQQGNGIVVAHQNDLGVGVQGLQLLEQGLKVMFCIGEKLEERESGQLEDVLRRQLDSGLPAGGDALEGRFAVAYEPVWAIGTGKVAGPDEVLATHAVVRRLLCERLGETGNRIPILYGGSVKPANAGNLIGLDNVDGLLIGGASLDAQSFVQIIRA